MEVLVLGHLDPARNALFRPRPGPRTGLEPRRPGKERVRWLVARELRITADPENRPGKPIRKGLRMNIKKVNIKRLIVTGVSAAAMGLATFAGAQGVANADPITPPPPPPIPQAPPIPDGNGVPPVPQAPPIPQIPAIPQP
ncbi:Hypothetical protein ERS075544_02717 [Mycobacteroides abscessus]|nr:Hypothetical protein ERS075544_02717 [Mycobacteroides abscessus]